MAEYQAPPNALHTIPRTPNMTTGCWKNRKLRHVVTTVFMFATTACVMGLLMRQLKKTQKLRTMIEMAFSSSSALACGEEL